MTTTASSPSTSSPDAPIVVARALRHAWAGAAALDGVDLAVRPGRITGFLGRNGAGKTTTMRILAGALVADGGGAVVAGCAAHDARARAQVGWAPEEPAVAAGLTVREQLEFAARLRAVSDVRGGVRDVIDSVGLTDCETKLCGLLSKGTRQRVGLAMALLGAPRVLLLDEPTAGLDPAQVASLRALLLRRRADGAAILFSTHVTAEVEALADDVVVVAAGRTVHAGGRETFAAAFAAVAGAAVPGAAVPGAAVAGPAVVEAGTPPRARGSA
jgi:ABC-2 type transport system ATP-binding protein